MSNIGEGALPLFKNGAFHADDWLILDQDEASDGREQVFLPLGSVLSLLQEGAQLPGKLGVIFEPDDQVELIAEHLNRISAVIVRFPSFGDGRGFSTARLLRERYDFAGEIRAQGAYLLDQMPMMERCGVDAFLVESDALRAGLMRGEWPEVTNYYQPTGHDSEDGIAPRPWLRRKVG